jgi:hypothetical protein
MAIPRAAQAVPPLSKQCKINRRLQLISVLRLIHDYAPAEAAIRAGRSGIARIVSGEHSGASPVSFPAVLR